MKLDDLPRATSIFIDANIFIYHFTGASRECTRFLARCEAGELAGVTSVSVLLEVLHRLMMVEAVRGGRVRPPNVLQKLRKRPEVVRALSEYYTHTMTISEMGISVRALPEDVLATSQRVRAGHGLLVGDSLLVAAMRAEGIGTLATHDADLRRIKGITTAGPGDVDVGSPSSPPLS